MIIVMMIANDDSNDEIPPGQLPLQVDDDDSEDMLYGIVPANAVPTTNNNKITMNILNNLYSITIKITMKLNESII